MCSGRDRFNEMTFFRMFINTIQKQHLYEMGATIHFHYHTLSQGFYLFIFKLPLGFSDITNSLHYVNITLTGVDKSIKSLSGVWLGN